MFGKVVHCVSPKNSIHVQISITVKPVLSEPVLNSHPLLSSHLSKPLKSFPLTSVTLTFIKRSPQSIYRSWSPFPRSHRAISIVLTCIKRSLCTRKWFQDITYDKKWEIFWWKQIQNLPNSMENKQTWCKFVYNNLITNIVRQILLSY